MRYLEEYSNYSQFMIYALTLSQTAPCSPPCPTALGLIGPKKKKKKTGFDDVSYVRSDLGPSVVSHCYSSLPPPSPSGFPIFIFHLCCLWYITKDNIWIIGKQPRSLENIPLETLFVTKPYESSPPPYRLGQISGGPPFECFCYDIDFGWKCNITDS